MKKLETKATAGTGLFYLALGLGIFCRVAQYVSNPSYWHDEAAIVLNVQSHSFLQLFGHLDFLQAAPPMFLAIERAMYLYMGSSEAMIRLPSLVVGIASLVLFGQLANRLLQMPWATVAMFAFALGDRFIWHATEAKPYGIDLYVALLLTYLAIDGESAPVASRRLLHTSVTAAIAMFFSYTTVIVYAAVALSLLPAVMREPAGRWKFLRGALLPAITFCILYATAIRAQSIPGLQEYWAGDFVPWSKVWMTPIWLAHRLFGLANYSIPLAAPVIFGGAIAGGVTLWCGGQKQLLGILAGPIGMTLLATAAGRYPFDGSRLGLFLTGNLLLLAILGLGAISQSVPVRWRPLTWVPPGYLLVVALVVAGMHLRHPRSRGDMRPIALYVAQHADPTDQIVALERCEFSCYWPAEDSRVSWNLPRADRITAPRFWIVFSGSDVQAMRAKNRILDWATQFAIEQRFYSQPGASAYLFVRLTGKPPATKELEPPKFRDE